MCYTRYRQQCTLDYFTVIVAITSTTLVTKVKITTKVQQNPLKPRETLLLIARDTKYICKYKRKNRNVANTLLTRLLYNMYQSKYYATSEPLEQHLSALSYRRDYFKYRSFWRIHCTLAYNFPYIQQREFEQQNTLKPYI